MKSNVSNRYAQRCEVDHSAAEITTASAQILPENPDRSYLAIQNVGAGTVYLAFDVEADADTGFQLAAGDTFAPVVAPVNAIFVIGAAASTVVILEGD